MLDLRLVMIDELGDEMEIDSFLLPDGLDDFALDLWKTVKEEEARERFPEASGFYFENRSEWNRLINQMIREGL